MLVKISKLCFVAPASTFLCARITAFEHNEDEGTECMHTSAAKKVVTPKDYSAWYQLSYAATVTL